MQFPEGPLYSFYQYLDRHVSLTEADTAFLEDLLPVKSYKRSEYLLREGQVSNAFFFNLSGFVRLYYNQEGEERTAYFYPEGTFISAYASFVRQTPSNFFLQATEDTTVVVISVEAAGKLLSYHNKFEVLARSAMEEELISHQEIIASLLTLRPEERYLELLEQNPSIFQRVSQLHIASYIGVKPESLSRIKKRHMKKS